MSADAVLTPNAKAGPAVTHEPGSDLALHLVAGAGFEPLDTVKIRLHRARRKLEAALAAHCHFSHDEDDVFVCEPAEAPAPETHRGAGAHPSAVRSS